MASSPAALMGQPDPAGLRAAHAAMVAGCGFLIARGAAPAGRELPRRPLVRLRMAGNGLKELDRFLAIMIDECLAAGGRDSLAAAPHTPVDTAARLHRLGRGGREWSASIPRLRAIARVRAAACGEPVLASWHRLGRDLAVASAGGAGQRPAAGAKALPGPAINDAAMAVIAVFYLALGDALWRHYGAVPAQP